MFAVCILPDGDVYITCQYLGSSDHLEVRWNTDSAKTCSPSIGQSMHPVELVRN